MPGTAGAAASIFRSGRHLLFQRSSRWYSRRTPGSLVLWEMSSSDEESVFTAGGGGGGSMREQHAARARPMTSKPSGRDALYPDRSRAAPQMARPSTAGPGGNSMTVGGVGGSRWGGGGVGSGGRFQPFSASIVISSASTHRFVASSPLDVHRSAHKFRVFFHRCDVCKFF